MEFVLIAHSEIGLTNVSRYSIASNPINYVVFQYQECSVFNEKTNLILFHILYACRFILLIHCQIWMLFTFKKTISATAYCKEIFLAYQNSCITTVMYEFVHVDLQFDFEGLFSFFFAFFYGYKFFWLKRYLFRGDGRPFDYVLLDGVHLNQIY